MLNQYIVFLRAVNVSGKNILKMASLKDVLSQNDFTAVQTYIQSGNILLKSSLSPSDISIKIQQLIHEHFNLQLTVFVLTADELKSVLDLNPFDSSLPPNKVFVTLLESNPNTEALSAFYELNLGSEEYKIINKIMYFYLPEGMATSKLSNSFIEKKLKVNSTGRNINTIQKLLSLAD